MARHVTVTEAARLTGRSPRTIARWIKNEQVESTIIDGRRMVDADTLTDTSDIDITTAPPPAQTPSVSMIPLADLAPLFDRLADAERRAIRAETELAWLRERQESENQDPEPEPVAQPVKVEEPSPTISGTIRERWKRRRR